jgi:hypothetical protein
MRCCHLRLLMCAGLVVALGCNETWDSRVEPRRPGVDMRLKLTIHADHLSVTVFNELSHERRLWDLENSWGWDSFSFELSTETGGQWQIRRRPREWTKNGPTFMVLPPGGSRNLRFNLNDGWWEAGEVSGLKDQTIRVRPRLEIGPTPEAEQYGVFVGAVLGEWVVSTPPHRWLFPAN